MDGGGYDFFLAFLTKRRDNNEPTTTESPSKNNQLGHWGINIEY